MTQLNRFFFAHSDRWNVAVNLDIKHAMHSMDMYDIDMDGINILPFQTESGSPGVFP